MYVIDIDALIDAGFIKVADSVPDGCIGIQIPASRRKKSATKPKKPNIPYEQIVDLYHETLPQLPAVQVLTDARKSRIRARVAGGLPDMGSWRRYYQYIGKSPFLTGQVVPRHGRAFVADFDWIVNEGNYVKIAEGRYHGGQ